VRRPERGETGQYPTNAAGPGWLDAADPALTSTMDLTRRTRELTLRGILTGASGSQRSREAFAVEIDKLRTSMIGLANSTCLGGAGGAQLFAVLSDIATHLRSDQAALPTDLKNLDVATRAVQAGLSAVVEPTGSPSDVEDIDVPRTITELHLEQIAYQAALTAGAHVVRPSLLAFLR
jgi:flagellar hook-associated protein 3 FlgL